MSGKSTATSSIGIGLPYFSRMPPPPGMPVPMPLWPVWKSTGSLRLGEHFVQRIRDRDRWGRTAAAADAASGRGRRPPTTSRCASRTASGPRVGSMLANGNRDVGVARRRTRRPRRSRRCGRPVSRSSTGEDDARHLARPVVVGQRRASRARRRSSPKYFCALRRRPPCRSPACSRWTCTSMAVRRSTSSECGHRTSLSLDGREQEASAARTAPRRAPRGARARPSG